MINIRILFYLLLIFLSRNNGLNSNERVALNKRKNSRHHTGDLDYEKNKVYDNNKSKGNPLYE